MEVKEIEYNLEIYCRENQKMYLTDEWIGEKNLPYSCKSLRPGSHRKMWWKCKNGHIWQCQIKDRVRYDSGCPYCTNRKVQKGFNDMESRAQEVAAQWHPTKNGELTSDQLTAGSAKKVWWQCELGHEWKAAVENRTGKGNACPFCSGKKAWPGFNDLKTLYPEIAEQWHPTMNGQLTPEQVRPGSGKKVWWLCKSGHTWDARIFSRTSKKRPGCPFCAGNVSMSRSAEIIGRDM